MTDTHLKPTAEVGVATSTVLFVSDVVAELDAAREAGMETVLAIRLGNPPVPANNPTSFSSFNEIPLP